MKLVLVYYASDRCSYGFEQVKPLEYSCKGDAEVDLMAAAEQAQKENKPEFEFAGHKLNTDYFFYYEEGSRTPTYDVPEFYELEEWFENSKRVD